MEARNLRDSTWVKGLFNGTQGARDTGYRGLRRWSNSRVSFADTTIGGNQAINAPPQFTLLADPPNTGVFAQPYDLSRSTNKSWLDSQHSRGSYREGLYYYETIEQNAAYLHCRFGKPKYLGVAAFFANMYDSKIAYLARTGDYPGVVRQVVAYTTAAVVWAAVGTIAFATIMLVPRILAGLLDKQASRYYYVKPTMHLYLRAVQNIVNTQLIYRRLVPTGMFGAFARTDDINGIKNEYHTERADLYGMLPDIWKANGEFDIYKMINRYQTLANYQTATLNDITSKATTADEAEKLVERFYRDAAFTMNVVNSAANYEVSLSAMEEVYKKDAGYYAGFDHPDNQENKAFDELNNAYGSISAAGGTADDFANEAETERKAKQAALMQEKSGDNPSNEQTQNWMDAGKAKTWGDLLVDYAGMAKNTAAEAWNNITTQAMSEIRNGAQWVTWRIDPRDSRSFSLSNSTKEPEISSTVNSATQKARSMEVNLSGGKTGFDMVDGLVSGLKSAFTGALDTLHLTGILSLYNSSVVDFPEVWDSSSMSGDDMTFTIPCRTDASGDLEILQEIILPVSFWLAAVAPLSTGKQSFTHPFYLEAYSRGRFSGRNCMVTSVSFNFGVGGLGWRPGDNVPLSCDINVTIRDLTRQLHMPLVTDPSVFDTDNKFSEFMAIIGGASLSDRTNGFLKMAMGFEQWKYSWKSAFSVGSITNQVFDLPPVRVVANLLSSQSR